MTPSNEFNFLPDNYCDRSVRRRLTAAGVAILAIFAIATVVGVYVSEQSLANVMRRNAEVTSAFDRAAQGGEQATALRNESERLVDRARRMTALVSGIPSSGVLAELTAALPPATSLTSVSIQSAPRPQPANVAPTAFDRKKAALESKRRGGPDPLPEIPPTDVVLRISGLGETSVAVSQFCENLSKSQAFQDVHLLLSEICVGPGNEKSTTRRFQIEATLNPSANLTRPAGDNATASIDDEIEAENIGPKETP